ncbi:hypothetical protein D9613_000438 [Agrocybe pediades]|uniref:Uncharacterized protein n=1 Tax=Agrocybe pediades TaxID=84607 RepID=A0A8H4QZY0_9AGAR|nr:hypothetical protein D9613_000438 [Agrocybe pediades]
MSLDFATQHYTHQDQDHQSYPPDSHIHHHSFDHPDPIDTQDHPNYSLFSDSSSTPFNSQRYRTNASSSSSLGHGFGINSDNMYSHPSFADTVPAFNGSNGNPYEMMNNLSSGKVSPLTPSDSVPNLHHPGAFPPTIAGKDYPPHAFGDVPERRLPASGYHADYPDDYSIGNINNGMPFGPSAMQHFNDRLGRFPPERYSHPPPSHNHDSSLMRGVAPLATNSFREPPSPYDDMHYLSSHQDVRMQTVDDTLARMKLHGHPMMGTSSDLQSFIRPYLDQYVRTPNRLAFGERTVIVMSSKVAQKSYGTEKRFLCPPPTAIMIVCINHGSTISLFHRLRSQTVSTKYLCVSGSGSSFKGSDGAPLMGLDQRSRSTTPSFIARTASWDPFVMYIVDVNKPAGAGLDAPPPPPPQPEYPSPPPNAIPFTNNGSQIPIYYNQTVVLQCLTSGVVSPVLIIRKVDHQTTVVGGGLQEGAKGIADHYCSPGEVCGDPVSQLHKIAFEVYDPNKGMPEPGTPGVSGAFLSCMGEKVNTYRPIDGRQWNTPQGTAPGATSPTLPSSPISPTVPTSNGGEYFSMPTNGDSAPASPSASEFLPSNDGGRVQKKKRSSSSAGIMGKPPAKGRRRPSSASSVSSSRRGSGSDSGATSGALWQVDIGETSVWTIVGTDQIRYNFYVPPVLFDNQHAPQTGSFPIPSKPVTPFPGVVKYLPPDRAAEQPKSNCSSSRAVLAKPNPHASKMLTVYGENFSKTDPVHVFFGSEPSPFVEVRCTEVLGCLPPESQMVKRRPIILIRSDGVVFPSSVMYP